MLKRTDALDLVPIRVHSHRIEDNGMVTILAPKFTNDWLAKLLFKNISDNQIPIYLDELGSMVWLAINGIDDTKTICDELSLKNNIEQVHKRVVKYLSGLYFNKHITFKQLEKIST